MAPKDKTHDALGLPEGNIKMGDQPPDPRPGEDDTTGDAGNLLGTMNYRKLGSLGEDVKRPGASNPYPLCVIRGQVTGVTKKGNDNAGQPSWALVGIFEGVNSNTGEVYVSGQCFLPGGIHDMVASTFLDVPEDSPSDPVLFAMEFSSIPAANKSGYTLVAKSLLPMQRADPIERIRKMETAFKALPKTGTTKAIAAQ